MGSEEVIRKIIYINISEIISPIADGNSGLQVIDVSNLAAPVLLNTILPHPTSRINKCIISNNLLIISDNNWNELYFYNISNPAVRLCLQKWCKIGKAEGEKERIGYAKKCIFQSY